MPLITLHEREFSAYKQDWSGVTNLRYALYVAGRGNISLFVTFLAYHVVLCAFGSELLWP